MSQFGVSEESLWVAEIIIIASLFTVLQSLEFNICRPLASAIMCFLRHECLFQILSLQPSKWVYSRWHTAGWLSSGCVNHLWLIYSRLQWRWMGKRDTEVQCKWLRNRKRRVQTGTKVPFVHVRTCEYINFNVKFD